MIPYEVQALRLKVISRVTNQMFGSYPGVPSYNAQLSENDISAKVAPQLI